MAHHFLYRVIRLASIVGFLSLVWGCAGTPVEREVFMGEGFQSSLPTSEARVLVWGNHSGAMTRTLGWLHDHQISAVDPSWIEKELTDPIFTRRTRMEQKRQVLAAAKSVGASLVLFTQVEDSQMGWKFDVMSFGHKRMKFIGVQIRGMNAETGDVVFGAKAWNSQPLAASEQLVMNLTTFALEKAFKESQPSASLHQNVHQQETPREHVSDLSPPGDEIPRISTMAVYTEDEAPMGKAETTLPSAVDDNLSKADPQPSLPLQPSVHQQEIREEFVASLSTLGDEEIAHEVSAVQIVEGEPSVTSQISSLAVYAGNEEAVGKDPMNLSSSIDDNLSKADPQASLPFQPSVHQQEIREESVAGLSKPRDEKMVSEVLVSESVEDQSIILPEQASESVDTGDVGETELDVTPMEAFNDEGTSEAVLQPYEGTSTDDSSVGLKIASGALSILYTPIKVTYAVLGGFFGSFSYILTAGNLPVAQSIWDASLQGDYWLTAKHLQGDEAIHFQGESSSIDTIQQARIDDAVIE